MLLMAERFIGHETGWRAIPPCATLACQQEPRVKQYFPDFCALAILFSAQALILPIRRAVGFVIHGGLKRSLLARAINHGGVLP